MLRRSIIFTTGLLLLHLHLPAQGPRTYPAARQGGNYMHNYYFPPAPSSTPWAPAWSPDGKTLAVAISGSIWTIDYQGAWGPTPTRSRSATSRLARAAG